jgi:hypothetical protein
MTHEKSALKSRTGYEWYNKLSDCRTGLRPSGANAWTGLETSHSMLLVCAAWCRALCSRFGASPFKHTYNAGSGRALTRLGWNDALCYTYTD